MLKHGTDCQGCTRTSLQANLCFSHKLWEMEGLWGVEYGRSYGCFTLGQALPAVVLACMHVHTHTSHLHMRVTSQIKTGPLASLASIWLASCQFYL